MDSSLIQLESHNNELATPVREPTDFLHQLASQVCSLPLPNELDQTVRLILLLTVD